MERPVQPNPYIPPGNGWTVRVRVPGHGVWSRNPGQVSQTYAVYNQNGRAYHVTIDSAFIDRPTNPNPGGALNTHVTSNGPVGGSVLHWPEQIPGDLSDVQQEWMDTYNDAGQFDALIAAFENRMRACAANVRPSRQYDERMVAYRGQRDIAAASERAAKADYQRDLRTWVNDYPDGEYQKGFNEQGEWYFLDRDRGLVVHLHPKPRPVMESGDLSRGFVNLCRDHITGKVPALEAEHQEKLFDQLTLVRIRDKDYAMLTSDFDDLPPAKDVLSAEQVVEQAVKVWADAAAGGKAYRRVASDQALMNVTGQDNARYHLKTDDLLDGRQLTRLGTEAAKTHLATFPVLAELPGVYSESTVEQLRQRLPDVARISHPPRILYLEREKLANDWSTELAKNSSVDATELARSLIARGAGRRVRAAQLQVDKDVGMTLYLDPDGGGSALLIGLRDKVLPNARVSGNQVENLAEHVKQLRSYLKGKGLSDTAVATGSAAAVVVRDNNGQSFGPPIFVDASTLTAFDLQAAREGFADHERKRQQNEKAAAAKAKAEDDEYKGVWGLMAPQLDGSGSASLTLYQTTAGSLVAVVPGSANAVAVAGAGGRLIETISITRTDSRRGKPSRLYRCFVFEFRQPESETWFTKLMTNKPVMPSGVSGYLLTRKG